MTQHSSELRQALLQFATEGGHSAVAMNLLRLLGYQSERTLDRSIDLDSIAEKLQHTRNAKNFAWNVKDAKILFQLASQDLLPKTNAPANHSDAAGILFFFVEVHSAKLLRFDYLMLAYVLGRAYPQSTCAIFYSKIGKQSDVAVTFCQRRPRKGATGRYAVHATRMLDPITLPRPRAEHLEQIQSLKFGSIIGRMRELDRHGVKGFSKTLLERLPGDNGYNEAWWIARQSGRVLGWQFCPEHSAIEFVPCDCLKESSS